MNKCRRLQAVFLTVHIVFFGQMAFAQESNVSLEDTLNWLTPHITKSITQPYIKGKTPEVNNLEWTLKSTDKCSLVWSGWKEGKERKSSNLLISANLSLSDFDPQRIELGPSMTYNSIPYSLVTLNTTDSKNLIKWKIKGIVLDTSEVSFLFRANNIASPVPPIRFFSGHTHFSQSKQKEMYERVREAFKHAIILCGGQQSKPKKPEPF